MYKMIREDDLAPTEDDFAPLPDAHLVITPDPSEREGYTYTTQEVPESNDNLCSCPVLPQSPFPQLYIAYGFKEDLFYLFMRKCHSSRIEFRGLVELTPHVDQQSTVHSLELRFMMHISSFREWI